MKPSPLPHYPEHTCYAVARSLVSSLGKRPQKKATDSYLAGHVSKPVKLMPYEIRAVARYYNKTFMVVPFGEKVQIALR